MFATKIHFVLVHGSCHGGWCWYKVANLLESAGHSVTAVDLGASGSNPKQLSDIPTYSGYLQPLADVLEALPCGRKVVLVGHSMGGVTISVAMEMFPSKIAIAIYCTAVMPTPDNFDLLELNKQYFSNIPFYGDSKFMFDSSGAATAVYFGSKYLAATLYQLSPPQDLKCCLKLARCYPIYRDETSRSETKLTSANYGSVNRAYIISDEDQAIPLATQQQFITKFPPKEVETISGSDHMPMFSKPQQLANYLQKIATKYVGFDCKVKKCFKNIRFLHEVEKCD